MNNLFKRTLALVFAILFIVTGVPVMSFAGETVMEPAAHEVDLSSGTGERQYTLNPEYLHTESFIVTGSNPDASIYVWGDCDIILRNASFKTLLIDYENSYTVNITLEGENTINQSASASLGAMDIFSSHVTINGGENDSLYASSRTFTVYSNSDALGSLTVNGGNITLKSAQGGHPLQTEYIQNGGNVTVIEDNGASFLYNVQLNGGTLEILNNETSNGIVFSQYVRIKKGADLKISIPNTPYVAYDNIKLAADSDANDCIFVRFDESSDYIYLNDDNQELAGKNYMEIKVMEHIHDCEDGVCPCGFVCKHNTDNGTCSICGKYLYKIAHQPTAEEPYVSLNESEGASYQWYEVSGLKEITDDDGVISVQSLEEFPYDGEGSYSEADGWTGVGESYEYDGVTEYVSYYFVKSFNAGDTVVVNISSPAYFDFFSTGTDWSYYVDEMTTEIRFTVEESGSYCLATYSLNEPATVKVYEGDIHESAMAGQTADTVTDLSYGKHYYCLVTAADGTVHKSDFLDNSYKITRQPTEEEPSVEINDNTGATYQWYIEKEDIVPVTDEKDVGFEVLGAPSGIGGAYSDENGWMPDADGYYFVIEMKAGDVLTLEFSQTPGEAICLYTFAEGTVESYLDITGATSLTAPSDGYYGICAANGGTLKATFNGIGYIAEEGQTEATLKPDKTGKYRCEVTFKDGTKKKSEIIEITHLHSFTSYTVTVEPKCGVPGEETALCDNGCDKKDVREIPAVSHTGTITQAAAKAPTCKETGWDAYEYCTACTYSTKVEKGTVDHKDEDGNYKCDFDCGYEYPKPEPPTEPTTQPTTQPSTEPSTAPSGTDTTKPTTTPTTGGSSGGEAEPTTVPVTEPSTEPATAPSGTDTTKPTTTPTTGGSSGGEAEPTTVPVTEPSTEPTTAPSVDDTTNPPSKEPSKPSEETSTKPSNEPEAEHKHTEVIIPAKEATYKATGLTEGKKCSGCGEIMVEQKKVARKKLKKVTNVKTKAVTLKKGSKSTLTLSWKKVTGAEKYEIQQYVNKKWKTIKTTKKTSFKITKLKANKTYKFRVRAVAGTNKGSYSKTYKAKTAPLKPTLTVKAGKKKLTASWKQVANITGYEVQYSTSKKFTKKTTKKVTIKKAKTKKTTIRKLKKGKKYYVRVRAYKTVNGKKIYSSWSTVKSVKVK